MYYFPFFSSQDQYGIYGDFVSELIFGAWSLPLIALLVPLVAILVYYGGLGKYFKSYCTIFSWFIALIVVLAVSYFVTRGCSKIGITNAINNFAFNYPGSQFDNGEPCPINCLLDMDDPGHPHQILAWCNAAISVVLFVAFSFILNWKLLPRGNYAKSIPFNLSK